MKKYPSVLWVKPSDLHANSPDCRATGCVDVVARLDYERLRQALEKIRDYNHPNQTIREVCELALGNLAATSEPEVCA